jgi:hypothetical protein
MSERYAIGVDLGGTNLRVALVGEEGEILKKIKEPSSGDVPGVLARTVRGLLGPGVAGVGIGVAGIIDRKEMRILTSPNLHSMDGFSFGTLGLDVPLVVEMTPTPPLSVKNGWVRAESMRTSYFSPWERV